jgi:hypothetical protein
MNDLKTILEAVLVVGTTDGTDLDSELIVTKGYMEFQISRRLVINSRTLLPSMDVHFRGTDGTFFSGFSGDFVTDEEAVMLNKMFIDGYQKTNKVNSLKRESESKKFWNELNK